MDPKGLQMLPAGNTSRQRVQTFIIIKKLYLLAKKKLSHDFVSGSEKTPCNKIDKPLVVYRFTGSVMTSITTLRT